MSKNLELLKQYEKAELNEKGHFSVLEQENEVKEKYKLPILELSGREKTAMMKRAFEQGSPWFLFRNGPEGAAEIWINEDVFVTWAATVPHIQKKKFQYSEIVRPEFIKVEPKMIKKIGTMVNFLGIGKNGFTIKLQVQYHSSKS